MKLHRPGRPEDLPDAGVLWARWAALAMATYDAKEANSRFPVGFWLDEDGLHYDDCGCTYWTMTWPGKDRAVLFGRDESGEVHLHEQAIDLLAGAPEWLSDQRLRELLNKKVLGCVYWFEGGAWKRADYPDDLRDDGLDCGIGMLCTREHAIGELCKQFELANDQSDIEYAYATCDRLFEHAERRALDSEIIRAFADGIVRIQKELEVDEEPVARTADELAAMVAIAQQARLLTQVS